MSRNRPRAAFLGSPAFAVPSLQATLETADVLLVVTQPDRPAGRGRKSTPTAVRIEAEVRGVETITWEDKGRAAVEERLAGLDLDVMVVVAFGRILRPSTLAIPRHGAINVHASLLPRWRGVAPIERAILAGDSETGVSLMVIDAGIDTGPTLAMRQVAIEATDTRVSLTERLARAGGQLLRAGLEAYVRGDLAPIPQPAEGMSYAPRLEKSEGVMNWSRSAIELWNQVRGLYEWPGAVTTLGGEGLKVHAVQPRAGASAAAPPPGEIVAVDGEAVRVATGQGSLDLLEVQLPGKQRVRAVDLARGRVLRVGDRLGS